MPLASRRRTLVLLSLLLASGFSVALVFARWAYTGELHYRNLVWNLFLAWLPFVFALVAYDRHRRAASTWAVLLPGLLWLLFLPNAPYLVTDYFLLREISDAPVWFDIVMLTGFAWTGLLLGFASLWLMQRVATAVAGRAAGWALAASALALSSLGIYLGRVLRWNSWDVFADPTGLLGDLAVRLSDPLGYPKFVAMTVLFTGFLSLAYFALYAFLDLALHEREEA